MLSDRDTFSRALAFLEAVLPPEGVRGSFVKWQTGHREAYARDNLRLLQAIKAADEVGHDTWYCTASLTRNKREGASAHGRKCLHIDCDVGDGKGFTSQKEAAYSVSSLLIGAGITPTLVSSGNGMHVYIILDRVVTPAEWQPASDALVGWCKAASLPTDHGVNHDLVRLLRVPGTYNRKDPENPKLVKLLTPIVVNSTDYVFGELLKGQMLPAIAAPPRRTEAHPRIDAVIGELPGQAAPASAARVADECLQLARMREEKRGDGAWYKLLGILAFCEDGEELAQAWSVNHEGYTPEETSEKLQRWRDQTTGSVSCATLDNDKPGICDGCKHKGKIAHPINLGREKPTVVVGITDAVQLPEIPPPFKWGQNGELILGKKSPDDDDIVICDRPVYIERLTSHEVTGHLACVFKHYSTKGGWREFTMTAETMAGQGARHSFARHMPQFHAWQWPHFQRFYIASQNALERQGYITMYDQFGFKPVSVHDAREIKSCVFGELEYFSNGSIKPASLTENLRSTAKAMRPVGMLEGWIAAASKLCRNGMEGHTYLLASGFAAMLMNLTGIGAPTMHGHSPQSGTGKTALLLAIGSIYGSERVTFTTSADTINARYIQLAQHCHIPVCWDELRERDSQVLDGIVMRNSVGRDKHRATQSGGLVETEAEWSTIVFSNANASIRELIGYGAGAGDDAAAARVFEIRLEESPYTVTELMKIIRAMQANAGHAGHAFVKACVLNLENIQLAIEQKIDDLQSRFDGASQHRYMIRIHATVCVTLQILARMGLLQLEAGRIIDYGDKLLFDNMNDRGILKPDPVAMLGQFLLEHTSNTLVVYDQFRMGERQTATRLPVGLNGCRVRVETKNNRIYIDLIYLRSWLIKKNQGPRIFLEGLNAIEKLIMVNPPRKMTITAGVELLTGAPVSVLEVNGNHEAISGTTEKVVNIEDYRPYDEEDWRDRV